MPGNIAKTYVSIFGNSQQFGLGYINGWYIQHNMSASPFIFREIFYSTTTWSNFPTFVLGLLYLYFSWYFVFSACKIANIMC